MEDKTCPRCRVRHDEFAPCKDQTTAAHLEELRLQTKDNLNKQKQISALLSEVERLERERDTAARNARTFADRLLEAERQRDEARREVITAIEKSPAPSNAQTYVKWKNFLLSHVRAACPEKGGDNG